MRQAGERAAQGPHRPALRPRRFETYQSPLATRPRLATPHWRSPRRSRLRVHAGRARLSAAVHFRVRYRVRSKHCRTGLGSPGWPPQHISAWLPSSLAHHALAQTARRCK